MVRLLASLVLVGLLVMGCGDAATPAGTQILSANVEADLQPGQRKSLVTVPGAPPSTVEFPDAQGSVEVEVVAASTDPGRDAGYLRSIVVKVKDAAGYQISAQMIGNPENLGTEEAPMHARLVQVTRRKGSAGGSSMAQMTLKVSPRGVERQ
ncbi:MAG: hypothetical protein JNK04_12365 [Myxococcales bacterium]|nr:hypothetical protein [Myxococcales bacterium]